MNRLTKMLTILDLRKKHLDSKAKQTVRVKWRPLCARSARLVETSLVHVAQERNINNVVAEKRRVTLSYGG